MRCVVARRAAQIRELEHHLLRFRRWSEAGVWEIVAVTLAEIMTDAGHYSINSITVRAYVSAAGGRGGLIDALLAASQMPSIPNDSAAPCEAFI